MVRSLAYKDMYFKENVAKIKLMKTHLINTHPRIDVGCVLFDDEDRQAIISCVRQVSG